MTAYDWAERIASGDLASYPRMAGYYNHNYRIDHEGRSYLLRIPIENSDELDLRQLPEGAVLRYLEDQGIKAPRLLYQTASGLFSIHNWVSGQQLNDRYPGSDRLPNWIPLDIARQMARLHRVDPTPLGASSTGLAPSPDAPAFFLAHFAFDCTVHRRLSPEMHRIYDALGIPADPFRGLDALHRRIDPRPFCLCHSDIHRKNIILDETQNALMLLDWELVLIGDPIYDLAVHFHKMRYAPDQETHFIDAYIAEVDLHLTQRRVRTQVDQYLKLERVKSAIIDAYRIRGDLLSRKYSDTRADQEVARYAGKLQKARKVWTAGEDLSSLSTPEIRAILTS